MAAVGSRSGGGGRLDRFVALPLLLSACSCPAGNGGDDVTDLTDASAPDDVDVGADDAAIDDVADGPDDGNTGIDCRYYLPIENRPGASPGVTCARMSDDRVEPGLLSFDGRGNRIILTGSETRPMPLFVADRRSRCYDVLDPVSDLPEPRYSYAAYMAASGSSAVYSVVWTNDTTRGYALREVEFGSGRPATLVAHEGPYDASGGPLMDSVRLDYPWVVWRDVRWDNNHYYGWYAYAYHLETREERNLSVWPDEPQPWDTVTVDINGSTVVFTGTFLDGDPPLYHSNIVFVDVDTDEHGRLAPHAADQWQPTITPDWIAWLDQRIRRDCSKWGPCFTDIYGMNRHTGEVRALVTGGNSMQGPLIDGEGDWIAYEDQRGGTDIDVSRDREQDIWALHLPTMTEIRVTRWPGFEMYPRVIDNGDGTWNVLLIEEIDYGRAIYRLWDCTLPTPEAP